MAKVKVNEVFGFVSDKRAKVSSNNTMPCGTLALVKL